MLSIFSISNSTPTTLNSSTSSVDDVKSNPNLGSTTKKRRIINKCKGVKVSLKDFCKKYQESMLCVLENSFIFGRNVEKEELLDIISNVVALVMEAI